MKTSDLGPDYSDFYPEVIPMLSSLDPAGEISPWPRDLWLWAGESAHDPQSQILLLQVRQSGEMLMITKEMKMQWIHNQL